MAALPSSPPLLPDDEAELPSSPPSLPSSANLPILPSNRKRHISDYETSLSSDPLFSDDPSGAEDQAGYERPKRKRMIKGPWWTLSNRSERRSDASESKDKDRFRNVDSGVWLGSDESIDSLLDSRNRLRDLNVFERALPQTITAPVSDGERIAQQTVNDCVDAGRETVDLSGLGLTSISSATLKPLHQMIRQSHGTLTEPPSEDEFAALTPSIKLFLARNRLSSLPHELYLLENVSVLSLRSNDLTELPSFIGKLRNLKELNVAGNHIRYLPWELLDYLNCHGDHSQITVRPNPLLEPTTVSGPSMLSGLPVNLNTEGLSRWGDSREYFEELRQAYSEHGVLDVRGELELRLKLGRMMRTQYLQEASRAGRELTLGREELIYLASSSIHYFDVDGTPYRKLSPTEEAYSAVLEPTSEAPPSEAHSHPPSLFEIALRSAQARFYLDDLPDALAPTVKAALQKAANGAESGNQTCSTCGRAFIIARAEWIEYWFNGFPSQAELTQETVLPFMRRACSWRCALPTEVGQFRC